MAKAFTDLVLTLGTKAWGERGLETS